MKKKILLMSILLISISSVMQWCSVTIGNTFIWWTLYCIIIYIFYTLRIAKHKILIIKIWLYLLGINIIYGILFMVENYWDWRLLVNNIIVYTMPVITLSINKEKLLSNILKFWYKYAWIILLLLAPVLASDGWGKFLVPYSFLALFYPLLNNKFKIIVLIAFILTVILGKDSRSDIIKYSICILLGFTTYRIVFNKGFRFSIRFLQYVFIVAPFIFLVLGITNTFNIFNLDEILNKNKKLEMTTSTGNEMSVLQDSRTFIYVEEINSAINNNYLWIGRSIARGYDSPSFAWLYDDFFKGGHAGERPSSEVSNLNVFNYFGLIGLCVYFLIFFIASNKGIRSNNVYMQIIGLYVAFRWLYGWVEDFSRFDLNMLFLWFMIGMCYSPYFTTMNNKDFSNWVRKELI